MEPNKSMTIGELEKKRGELNTSIAEAIQKFESETGTRIGHISTIRKREHSEKGGDCRMSMLSEDQGDVVTVNVNMKMDF